MRLEPFALAAMLVAAAPGSTWAGDASAPAVHVGDQEQSHRVEVDAASEYRHAVAALEQEHGAYDPRLSESLLALAQVQRARKDYRQAAQSLQRALHITRINGGLYDLAQVRIIDALIDLQSERRKWKDVDRAYALLHWIYRQNYAADDPRLLPALKRLRAWHLGAYGLETGAGLDAHFRMQTALYEQGIAIVERQTGDHRQALCFWYEACCSDSPNKAYHACPKELAGGTGWR
ncbi:MAG: tetratricopeptide repeat protein [Gammaproteobacteria bacterium]